MDRISSQFSATYRHISEDKEQARIEYKSSLYDTPFLQSLSESKDRDRILQRTTKGIHKDDLKLIMNDDQLKVYASQGQLKSFIMALKLSQYKIIQSVHKNTPILLLDDIFDKLDQERVKWRKIRLIAATVAQTSMMALTVWGEGGVRRRSERRAPYVYRQ